MLSFLYSAPLDKLSANECGSMHVTTMNALRNQVCTTAVIRLGEPGNFTPSHRVTTAMGQIERFLSLIDSTNRLPESEKLRKVLHTLVQATVSTSNIEAEIRLEHMEQGGHQKYLRFLYTEFQADAIADTQARVAHTMAAPSPSPAIEKLAQEPGVSLQIRKQHET